MAKRTTARDRFALLSGTLLLSAHPKETLERSMHTPSSQQQEPNHRTPGSPKKKGSRHVVTRQIFALPVLQQFEPVLASSPRSYMVPTSSIPKIDIASNGNQVDYRSTPQKSQVSPAAAALSPSSSPSPVPHIPHHPPHRPKDKEAQCSPRVLRPQPPPPLGISARADVDIYRYSQGTTQRMAIRPIFKQRKEEEAQIARHASTQREDEETRKATQVLDAEGGHHRREEETSLGDHGGLRVEHGVQEHEGSLTSADEDIDEFTPIESVSVRFGETRENHLDDEKPADLQDVRLGREENENVTESAHADAPLPFETDGTAIAEDHLVRPLLPGCYHEPFLTNDGDQLSWLKNATRTISHEPSVSTKRPQSASEHKQPEAVLHKLLWKDLRSFDGRDVMVSVLLSSEGAAHIAIANWPSWSVGEDPQCDGDCVLQIADSHLTVASQVRGDLRVFTPKWAEWIISRVHMDANGSFYLQLEERDGLEKSCCFVDDLVLDGNNVHVEMHKLGDADLLVSVRDLASGELGTFFIHQDEILQLAETFGTAGGEMDGCSKTSMLFQNAAFLFQLATKSKAIRLGMKNGDMLNDICFQDARSGLPEVQTKLESDVEGVAFASVLELQGVLYPKEIYEVLLENSSLASVAFLSQAFAGDGILSALRHLQQKEAVNLHAHSYVLRHSASAQGEEFNALIASKVDSAKQAKLREVAICSIVEDMATDFIAYECRVELYEAKYSGGYDDYYASKVQATYRMSAQRKTYSQKKHVRMRAARLLQALQRGIVARKRYVEMRIEREKYLFYGFRSSLDHATASMEDPRKRTQDMADETERKRQHFLMQVLDGYVTEHGIPFHVPAALVESLFNEFGVVVGCPRTFGDTVASILRMVPDGQAISPRPKRESIRDAPRLYSSGQVNAALLLGLRSQYDDTFGLSSTTRKIVAGGSPVLSSREPQSADASPPPRWLLKVSPPFQRSNRNRLAALRLSRKSAGRKASHLVARDFRNVLSDSLSTFESCRASWESSIRRRKEESQIYDLCSKEEVVQRVLDQLIASIKDWGVDPEPLFAGLNMCVQHRQGKEIVGIVEAKFDAFAEGEFAFQSNLMLGRLLMDTRVWELEGVNQLHNKKNIFSLRDEIEQELEDFEKLLALRCLNIGQDHIVTIPPSEILHIVLNGKVDDEYIRHALPTVLPIASVNAKHELARKMVLAYANSSYGDAFNAICWSCLDVSENVTVEAAQLLDRMTKEDDEMEPQTELEKDDILPKHQKGARRKQTSSSVASRALYLLTGSQAIKFLQFIAKVAHFNKAIQHRVQSHLKPYAAEFELFRLASALSGLDDFGITARLFDNCFATAAIYPCTSFWIQYEELFGLDLAEKACACYPTLPVADGNDGDGELRRASLMAASPSSECRES